MAWEPMPYEEARKVLESIPQSGTTSPDQWARYTEAMLVENGVPPERIKAAVESILGHPPD